MGARVCAQTIARVEQSLVDGVPLDAPEAAHIESCLDCAKASAIARELARALGRMQPDTLPRHLTLKIFDAAIAHAAGNSVLYEIKRRLEDDLENAYATAFRSLSALGLTPSALLFETRPEPPRRDTPEQDQEAPTPPTR